MSNNKQDLTVKIEKLKEYKTELEDKIQGLVEENKTLEENKKKLEDAQKKLDIKAKALEEKSEEISKIKQNADYMELYNAVPEERKKVVFELIQNYPKKYYREVIDLKTKLQIKDNIIDYLKELCQMMYKSLFKDSSYKDFIQSID